MVFPRRALTLNQCFYSFYLAQTRTGRDNRMYFRMATGRSFAQHCSRVSPIDQRKRKCRSSRTDLKDIINALSSPLISDQGLGNLQIELKKHLVIIYQKKKHESTLVLLPTKKKIPCDPHYFTRLWVNSEY